MATNAPDALLFTAPGCPHCPGVKVALEKLHTEGLIATLEVVNVADEGERAAALGVRSVPWLILGEFVLTGAQTPQQLRQWAERAATGAMRDYLEKLLMEGGLAEAERLLANEPRHLAELPALIADTTTPIQVRLGVGALIEGLEGSKALRALLPELIRLSDHTDHRIRSDACHYLGLSHDLAAREALRKRLDDLHPEVREIAADALELIEGEEP